MPLLMPAAAQERLAGTPNGAASHWCVEIVINFVSTMLKRHDPALVQWQRQSSALTTAFFRAVFAKELGTS